MAVHGKAQQRLVEGVDLLGEVGVLGRKACGNPEILTFFWTFDSWITLGRLLDDSWPMLANLSLASDCHIRLWSAKSAASKSDCHSR